MPKADTSYLLGKKLVVVANPSSLQAIEAASLTPFQVHEPQTGIKANGSVLALGYEQGPAPTTGANILGQHLIQEYIFTISKTDPLISHLNCQNKFHNV